MSTHRGRWASLSEAELFVYCWKASRNERICLGATNNSTRSQESLSRQTAKTAMNWFATVNEKLEEKYIERHTHISLAAQNAAWGPQKGLPGFFLCLNRPFSWILDQDHSPQGCFPPWRCLSHFSPLVLFRRFTTPCKPPIGITKAKKTEMCAALPWGVGLVLYHFWGPRVII